MNSACLKLELELGGGSGCGAVSVWSRVVAGLFIAMAMELGEKLKKGLGAGDIREIYTFTRNQWASAILNYSWVLKFGENKTLHCTALALLLPSQT